MRHLARPNIYFNINFIAHPPLADCSRQKGMGHNVRFKNAVIRSVNGQRHARKATAPLAASKGKRFGGGFSRKT